MKVPPQRAALLALLLAVPCGAFAEEQDDQRPRHPHNRHHARFARHEHNQLAAAQISQTTVVSSPLHHHKGHKNIVHVAPKRKPEHKAPVEPVVQPAPPKPVPAKEEDLDDDDDLAPLPPAPQLKSLDEDVAPAKAAPAAEAPKAVVAPVPSADEVLPDDADVLPSDSAPVAPVAAVATPPAPATGAQDEQNAAVYLRQELNAAKQRRSNIAEIQKALTADVALLRGSTSMMHAAHSRRARAAAERQTRQSKEVVQDVSAMLRETREETVERAAKEFREAQEVRDAADALAKEASEQLRLYGQKKSSDDATPKRAALVQASAHPASHVAAPVVAKSAPAPVKAPAQKEPLARTADAKHASIAELD